MNTSIESNEPAPLRGTEWKLPGLGLLAPAQTVDVGGGSEERTKVQETIVETLAEFGIAVTAGAITCGPAITRYEIHPAKGVRMDKIASLERDIARATRAERINILAPIPGKGLRRDRARQPPQADCHLAGTAGFHRLA